MSLPPIRRNCRKDVHRFEILECFRYPVSNHFDVCWCGLDRPDGKVRKPSRNWRGLFRFVSLWIPTWQAFHWTSKKQDECIRTKIKLSNHDKVTKIYRLRMRRNSQNMFARCTKWHSQDTNCEGPNLPLTESDNAMNLGFWCGSSFVHFHVLRVRHLRAKGVVFARRRNWNSQRCKLAGRKVMY